MFHNTLEGFKEGGGIMKKIADLETNEAKEDNEEEDNEEENEEDGEKKEKEEKEEGEEKEENKEGFLGTNMIAKKVLNKNFIGNLRNSLTNNLTDLDRFLKTKSEKNTIGATKQ